MSEAKRFDSSRIWPSFLSQPDRQAEKFSQVFNSFGMSSMVNQGKARMRGYRTQGTPEMVVNGKYRVSSRMAGGFEGMLKVADFLIAKSELPLNAQPLCLLHKTPSYPGQ